MKPVRLSTLFALTALVAFTAGLVAGRARPAPPAIPADDPTAELARLRAELARSQK